MALEFVAAKWPAPENVCVAVTTRPGGTSEGRYTSLNLGDHVGDDPERVGQNRERLMAELGLPAPPVWLEQVHGADVVDLDAAGSGSRPTADAAFTRTAGRVAAVLTADCLPVVFSDVDGGCVAAAHAGWRGLVAGVLEATLEAMRIRPSLVTAWLGPAISQGAYEVDATVRDAFVAAHSDNADCFIANEQGRWQANLYALARLTLKRAGVASVHGGGFCTYLDQRRFFSHRRESPCGRMATLIWLAEPGQNTSNYG